MGAKVINNCKQVSKDRLTQGELSTEEISDAENHKYKGNAKGSI